MHQSHIGYDRTIRKGSFRYLWLYLLCWFVNVVALFGSLAVFWKWVAVPIFKLNYFTSIWAAIFAYILLYLFLHYRFKWPKPKLESSFMYNAFGALMNALVRPIAIIILSGIISVVF